MREKRSTAVARWLCTNNTKNMFVKIVHQGGHVELHDRPIIAAEIIHRNPKCFVAYPNVFKQPWAIVAPETTLMPGQKFYVVPISTVRKLQLLAKKYSASQLQENETTSPYGKNDGDFHHNKVSYSCFKQFQNGGKWSVLKERKDDNRYACLIGGIRIKARGENKSKETGWSKSFESPETDALTHKKTKDYISSPKRLSASYYWQPSLESISEDL